MINSQQLRIFPEPDDLFNAAALDFAERTTNVISTTGCCSVVLSGGNTPKQFYTALQRHEQLTPSIAWDKIYFFFADERYLPASHIENNYHIAETYLFSQVAIPKHHIFRIPTELPTAEAAAKQYEATLRDFFSLDNHQWPIFNLTYLGMGADGHTASLIPYTNLVKHYTSSIKPEASRFVKSLWVDHLKMYRITLTPPAINQSQQVIFLTQGAEKASALKEVIEIRNNPMRYPAILIREAIWYVDRMAASALSLCKKEIVE